MPITAAYKNVATMLEKTHIIKIDQHNKTKTNMKTPFSVLVNDS